MHTVWLSNGRETSRRKYTDACKTRSEGSQRCLVSMEIIGGRERKEWWEIGVVKHQGYPEREEKASASEVCSSER